MENKAWRDSTRRSLRRVLKEKIVSQANHLAGILDLDVALPHHYLPLQALARARGVDPQKYLRGLGCHKMAVCAPGEDTVTLAAQAAYRLLQRHPLARQRVGLCVVGTESGIDHAKPVSILVHGLLGLPHQCRTFDIKHACYGATAALQTALAWVQQHPKQLALVIASDIARYPRLSPGEPTQGAGSVAMLVHADSSPSLLSFPFSSGIHASHVHDFWRPNYNHTAIVDGKFSLQCYLAALKAAYLDFCEKNQQTPQPDFFLFHAPFPRMAHKAYRSLAPLLSPHNKHFSFLEEGLSSQVLPALWPNREVGNLYTGSLYLSLAGLREHLQPPHTSQHVAFFSYGSGSCSEFFLGKLHPSPRSHTPLRAILDARVPIDVPTYEAFCEQTLALETNQTSLPSLAPLPSQPFSFLGILNHKRQYRDNTNAAIRCA